MKGFPPPAPLAFTPPKIQEGFEIPVAQSVEGVEGEKVLVSAKEDEVVEKIVVENVAEVEKDLKVQEGVSCCNCDAQMTPGHQCELESDKIEDSVTAKVVEEDESDEQDSDDWADESDEQDLYPTLDVDSDDWAEIRRFHGSKAVTQHSFADNLCLMTALHGSKYILPKTT